MWDRSLLYWLVLGALNFPLYVGAGRMLFGTWSAFRENLRHSFTPEVVSMMRGELSQRWGAEFKLLAFVGGCALVVVMEHLGLSSLGFGLGA